MKRNADRSAKPTPATTRHLRVLSANGAASNQPGATPHEQCPPSRQGLKARANGRAVGPGFQPSWIGETVTQGVALGWDGAGALPLRRARP